MGQQKGALEEMGMSSLFYMNLKTAVKPQRAQRIGSKAGVHSMYKIHLLGDYSVFPFLCKYHDVFSVFSLRSAYFWLW